MRHLAQVGIATAALLLAFAPITPPGMAAEPTDALYAANIVPAAQPTASPAQPAAAVRDSANGAVANVASEPAIVDSAGLNFDRAGIDRWWEKYRKAHPNG